MTPGLNTMWTAREAADRLARAAASGQPCPPVRDLLGEQDVERAYEAQQVLIRRRVAAGGRIVGRKIGLTSSAVQAQLGVNQPDFGVLFADMDMSAAPEVQVSGLIAPKIEAEVAFVLGGDLTGEQLDLPAVRGAVDYAVAALEIVDSRITGWDIRIADTIADNASSALFVLGRQQVRLTDFEPRDVKMAMTVDGKAASEGSGAACLGDPLAALQWLAVAARDLGDPLRAGHVVLSGALGPMVPVTAGSTVRADICPLGSVSVTFTQEKS